MPSIIITALHDKYLKVKRMLHVTMSIVWCKLLNLFWQSFDPSLADWAMRWKRSQVKKLLYGTLGIKGGFDKNVIKLDISIIHCTATNACL